MHESERLPPIPSLTAIRGVAALVVVMLHVHDTFPNPGLHVISWFQHGALGVDLFFVLSGFIMAYVYARTPVQHGLGRFALGFLQSRLARIYPLHLVTLLFTLALVVCLPGFAQRYSPDFFAVQAFALNLLLMHNWGFVGTSWNMVSWSISAEWFMYLLFPLLVVARSHVVSRAPRHCTHVFAGLIACVLGAHLAFIMAKGWSHYGGMGAGGMVRVLFEFTLGFLVYQVRDRLHPRPGTLAFEMQGWTLVVLIVLAFASGRLWIVFVPTVALLIATLGTNLGGVARLLERRSMVYLGEISFSLYMWHWLVIQIVNVLRAEGLWAVNRPFDAYLQACCMIGMSLLIAMASYSLIERPARAWVNRLLRLPGHR